MAKLWQALGLVLQFSHVLAGVSLDYVTVLLPHHIQGVGRPWLVVTASTSQGAGCVNWTLNDKEIIVTPIATPECAAGTSLSAEISSIAFPGNSPRSRERIAAWVNVTEVTTGAMLEFEVFVDAIHRLDMLLNTHVVGVEAYEILDLQAFDDKNNVFTTLVGLPFDWSIDLHNILKPVTFNETGGKVPKYYQENEGTGTDRFPVKGVSAGKAHVSASLRDPHHPISTQEIILVKEKLQIRPIVAYVAPLSEITYTLDIKRRENKMENGELKAVSEKWVPKKMPSDQYKWYLSNLNIGSIDREMGTATGLELGSSTVTVNDTTLSDHFHSAKLYVVEPVRANVRFEHGPCRDGNTYVTVNQTVDVTLELFDKDNNSLTITKNVELHVAQSGSGRVLLEGTRSLGRGSDLDWHRLSVESASHLKLRALEEGELTIHVRLGRIFNTQTGVEWPTSAISASSSLVVSSPVSILSRGVVLPVPTSPAASVFHVEAVGGSELYEWSSGNKDIATTLSDTGFITAQKAGSTSIWVTDRCNPHNKASVPVAVSNPTVPEFLPSANEVQVGSLLDLAVGIVDTEGRRFSNCSSLILDTTIVPDVTITKTHDPRNRCVSECPQDTKRGCWTLTVRALVPGFVEVRAALPFQDKAALKPLAAFAPLESPEHIVLIVGSNMTFEWSGGPLPWPSEGFKALLYQMKHFPDGLVDMSARTGDTLYQHVEGKTTLNSAVIYRGSWEDIRTENKSALVSFKSGDYVARDYAHVTITKTASSPHQITVTCLDSTYENPIALELRVGNTPTSQNQHPVVAKSRMKLTCYPRIQLLPAQTVLGLKTHKQLEIHAIDKLDSRFKRLQPTHPLLKLIKWKVNADEVVNITQTGLVTGLKLGQTPVSATLNLPELETMSAEEITRIGLQEVASITVVFEDFVIKTPTKHILQNFQTVLYLEGRNGEVPIDSAFEHINVQWTVDSQVVELLPVLHSGTFRNENRNVVVEGFSIGVRGRRPGNFVVTAKIFIDQPETTSGNRAFEATLTMTVLDPLTLVSPSFLLLPHGASATIVTNLDNSGIGLSYQAIDLCKTKVCDQPIIRVDNKGNVRARGPHTREAEESVAADEFGMVVVETPGADGFTVPSKHTHMSQTKDLVSVLIEVRAPSHLSLRVAANHHSGPLCVGSNRTVELVLRDRLGRVFHSLDGWDTSDLKIEVNHPEVASISEAEAGRKLLDVIAVLNISAVGSNGLSSAVAKIWLENQPYVAPLYVRIETAALDSCLAPTAIRARLHFKELPSLTDSSLRKEWETKVVREIAGALDTPVDRINVATVSIPGRFIDVDLVPSRSAKLHEDQWHLATQDTSSRSSVHLLAELEKQVLNAASVLKKGAIAQKLSGRIEKVESEGTLGWMVTEDANDTALNLCPAPPAAGYDFWTSFLIILLITLIVILVGWVLSVGGASRSSRGDDRIDPRQPEFHVRSAPLPAY